MCFKTDFNDLKHLITVEKEKLEAIKNFNRTMSNIAMVLSVVNISADEILRRDIDDFRRQLIEARNILLELLKSVKVS